MQITLIVGVFFLVLAAVFAIAGWRDYLSAQRQWTTVSRVRFRTAISFTIVGTGLVLWKLFSN